MSKISAFFPILYRHASLVPCDRVSKTGL